MPQRNDEVGGKQPHLSGQHQFHASTGTSGSRAPGDLAVLNVIDKHHCLGEGICID